MTYYASARALDPMKGDVLMDGGAWKEDPPMVAVVTRVMRTQRGTYLLDPTFGVDWSPIDKQLPNVRTQVQAAITEALRYYLDRGLITSVVVDVSTLGAALLWTLTFSDPRQPGVRASVNGQLS